MDQQHLVTRQFGSTAGNYLTSTVHAQGKDLGRLTDLARELQPGQVLDLGCGGGHASFALASGTTGEVVAYDLADEMLGVVAAEAARRQLGNIRVVQGSAASLPFEDGRFQLVASRFSAHHWMDVERGVAEAARVLAPGGTLVIIDVIAPETPLYDTALQTIELLRDASHVRDYRLSEWRRMLAAAGLPIADSDSWKLPLSFDSWVQRMGTSAARIAALKVTIDALPREARDYFSIQADYSFASDTAWMRARAA